MKDALISRQAAINAVKRECAKLLFECDAHYDYELKDDVYDDIKEADAILRCNKHITKVLKRLPTTGDRKAGRWIEHSNRWDDILTFECSNCKQMWKLWGNDGRPHYCPNCGAKMEEQA